MSYTPYKFRADIYTREYYADDSGQSVDTWTYSKTIKCTYMPSRGTERLVGRVQNPHSYTLWTDDLSINYDSEIRDLRDRTGNMIAQGRFNVTGIKKFPGWAGIHHLELDLQAVLD